ncbi:MAG: D-cysteine desulfhydrase family protein [Actinomycetia bacterium]|nr:D-cysteine desulfhydrase family protein [Actinomycetes bacterium]
MRRLPSKLERMPRRPLAHLPTPLEPMVNLARHVGRAKLLVKRDDCTGLAMGGNKVRQLEFYLGDAAAVGADTLLITGAVQSNFVRSTIAAGNRLGMHSHVQLEQRLARHDPSYAASGNVLLDILLGATIHSYPDGEDEAGADARLESLANELRAEGHRPYVIHLAPGHAPLGALGYVVAAGEILQQVEAGAPNFDEVVVASGSGHTHAGLLFGLRALGCAVPVTGVCVRRDAQTQRARLISRTNEIAELLEVENPVDPKDVVATDAFLAPGYGQLNPQTQEAISLAARYEALLLDPVYSGKAMAAVLERAGDTDTTVLFIHTGGTPALFAYQHELTS